MAGFPRLAPSYDIAILGGGHAGLQAGLKAALLNQTAAIIDRGPKYSRSYYAPRMDNIPGFPDGISGHKLLDLQIAAVRAASEWTGYFTPAIVTEVRPSEGGFEIRFDWLRQPRTVRARAVVLALGVVDRMPVIDGKIDAIFPWANQALVDFCEICDGHTFRGRSVAVLGDAALAARTALDLRHFGPTSIEIVTFGAKLMGAEPAAERDALAEQLRQAGVTSVETPVTGYDGIREKRFVVRFADGTERGYDLGFSALGWYDQHGTIPRSLGASFDPEGFVRVDESSRVLDPRGEPIPGLYCAGDLANRWNQIPEAWAQAERAVIHAWAEYL